MSAQPSLLISTRLLSSEVLEASPNTHDMNLDDQVQATNTDEFLTPLVSDLFPLQELIQTSEQTQVLHDQATQTKQALRQIEDKLNQDDNEQLNDIEALQQSILNDAEFDFSLLPATAAGQNTSDSTDNNESLNPPSESFASNVYIETSSTDSYISSSQQINIPEDQTNIPLDSSQNTVNFIEDETDHTSRSLDTLYSSATEDIRYQVNGLIDSPYQLESGSQQTEYGQIEYKEDGSWQYTLNNSSEQIQALSATDTLSESIQLNSKSGDSFTLNITIYGINDIAIISGENEGEIAALGNDNPGVRPETIQGKLSVSDADHNEANMVAESDIKGSYGSVDINAEGKWVYSLNSDSDAVKSLHESDTLFDLIPVKSIDGSNQLLKITIHGADDSPFLSGDNAETINISDTVQAEQKLNIDDPDFGQSRFQAEDAIASRSDYGTGSIDEHGNWKFELNIDNPDVANLGDSEFLFDTFTVSSADGTTQTIIIKIEGSDQPVFANTGDSLNDELIAFDQHSDEQQTLDTFLENSANSNQSIPTAPETTITSSGEILQQLQQHTFDNNLVS